MRSIFWVFSIICIYISYSTCQKKIVCYFGSWVVYHTGDGAFDISTDIDPTLCTHLIYAFVGMDPKGAIKILDEGADLPSGSDGYNKFNELRKRSPDTVTLISIGGWNEKSVNYSIVAGDSKKRKLFAESARDFCKKYHFQGLDMDWEYPTKRGGNKKDKENFVLLLKEIKEIFEKEGLLLSAAVGVDINGTIYDVRGISKYLDWINLMTYDYADMNITRTQYNAPLYGVNSKDKFSVDASVHDWLARGAPRDKLVMGIPFYGKTFILKNVKDKRVGAATLGRGPAGPYSGENGTLSYNEICTIKGKKDYYDKKQVAPYAINDTEWITYDNPRSIKEKVKYINDMNLGGAVIWSIDSDDYNGKCGEKHILLKTINKEINKKR